MSAIVMSFSIGAVLGVSRVLNAEQEELQNEEQTDTGEKIYDTAEA